jgi:uncharacterized protein
MGPQFELRKTGDTTVDFDGYPSLFNKSYTVGPMTEVIAPGAFSRSLDRPVLDVVLRVEHRGCPLARTTSGTLTLSQDGTGLRSQATLDTRDPEVQSLLVKYERGDLRQMSFAFRCERDEFSPDHSTRTIRSADLHRGDVSIVTYGASSTTFSTLSRAERRAMADQLRATGWFGPGLVLRQMGQDASAPGYDDGEPGEGEMVCPACNGSGTGSDGMVCGACGGTGVIPDDDRDEGDAGRSARAKYSSQELQRMVRLGRALPNAAGDPSYPIDDREDVRRAVRAVGRGSRSSERIRLHIIKNAKRLGAMDLIPDTWASDGSLKRSRPSTPAELRRRGRLQISKAAEAELLELRRGMPPTAFDRREAIRRTSRMATAARRRGDWRLAHTLDRSLEIEALLQAEGAL